MELVFPDNPKRSMTLTIGSGDSETGPRIGGRSPSDVSSLRVSAGRFFATVPVSREPLLEASIFLNWQRFVDFEGVPANSIQCAGREYVDILLTAPAGRRGDSSFSGPLSEHPLILGAAAEDEVTDTENENSVRSGHKLGGTAFLIQPRDRLISELKSLAKGGYRHVVQFDYIAPGDAAWQGRWPFGDGLFNVFGRVPFEDGSWRWLWQY